jgi:hypothetical protein
MKQASPVKTTSKPASAPAATPFPQVPATARSAGVPEQQPSSPDVPGPRRVASRRRPAQAGPVTYLEVGNPLQLTKTMRGRLLGAVRSLVGDPALSGALDSVRLGAVVLMAKADARRDFHTSIWAEELGRWLGVSRSSVAHTVLPRLRKAQVLDSDVVTAEEETPAAA